LSKAALLYGYGEIRTPILEFSELFRKGLGDESDVALVAKARRNSSCG